MRLHFIVLLIAIALLIIAVALPSKRDTSVAAWWSRVRFQFNFIARVALVLALLGAATWFLLVPLLRDALSEMPKLWLPETRYRLVANEPERYGGVGLALFRNPGNYGFIDTGASSAQKGGFMPFKCHQGLKQYSWVVLLIFGGGVISLVQPGGDLVTSVHLGSMIVGASQDDSRDNHHADEEPTLLKRAALVVTMDPALGDGPLGLLRGADVLFDEDGIVAVGSGLSPITANGRAKVIDVSGKIVMPGFVDTHTHLWQSAIRGCLLNLELPGWLSCNAYARGQNVTYDEAYTLVRLATLDAINSGVTTVTDFSHAFSNEFVEGNIEALVDSGMRFVYAYNVPAPRYDHFRDIKLRRIDPNPLATIHVAAAARLSSVETLVEAVGLAKESNTYINTHFREHVSDLDQGQLEALEQSGALTEVPLLLAHAVHLSDDDIATLDRPNVHLSHQPLSNMRLASGVIRFPSLATAGISVGLGLDGGTNDTSDMFMNMRAAVGLQRATTLNASVYPTPADVLKVATLGGATALGKQDQIGSLTPGKQADVLVLDPHTINWGPSWDWVGQIVYSAAPVNVEWVFVRGQTLKARGKLNYPKNMTELVSRAEAVAARLKLGITGTAEPY